MKILFDVLTPKQARMAVAVWKRFTKNHEFIITSREYAETNDVFSHYQIPYTSYGKYSEEKNQKFRERINRLQYLAENHSSVDLVITQASIEAVHFGVGLGKPVVVLTDALNRKYLNRQIIPTANFHLREELTRGHWHYEPDQAVYMDACQEQFYTTPIKRHNPNLVVYRSFEYHASYTEGTHTLDIREEVKSFCTDHGFDFLELERYKSHDFIPPENMFKKAAMVITGGSSMAVEATLLKIPAISFYPGEFLKFDYLIDKDYPLLWAKKTKNVRDEMEKLLNKKPTSHQFSDDPLDKLNWVFNKIEEQLQH